MTSSSLDPEVSNLPVCREKATTFLETQENKKISLAIITSHVPGHPWLVGGQRERSCDWMSQQQRQSTRERLVQSLGTTALKTLIPVDYLLLLSDSPLQKTSVQVRSLICICYFQWQTLASLCISDGWAVSRMVEDTGERSVVNCNLFILLT